MEIIPILFRIYRKFGRLSDVLNGVNRLLILFLTKKISSEDERENSAERFEMHIYEFIDERKVWYQHLEQTPAAIEEAEDLTEIKEIAKRLHAPLELNFLTELELIIEGKDQVRFD